MPLQTIGEYRIQHLSVLDERGEVDASLEPKLADDQLWSMYRAMVLSREVDEKALKLQRQGRMGTFAPAFGQEAASAGPAFAMGDSDWFVGAFREQAGWFVRGMPLKNFFLYYNGFEEGNVFDPERRLLPVAVIVASQMLHAVGLAYAAQVREEKDTAVVAFFGDGGTSQGDFHEALNFAGVWKAPTVFVCQNNGWAISVPRSKQTSSKTLAQKALAYDIPGIQVDGNDVLAMYRATREALDRAHAGDGPTLIEAVTYRQRMHTTADDPTKYRDEEEAKRWLERDPIDRFRIYLERKGIWNEDREHGLREMVRKEIDEAVQAYESYQDFKPDSPFDHVYGTEHEEIEAQRAEFLGGLERVG